MLACTGRHDRTCVPAASEAIAAAVPHGEAHLFDGAGHMSYVEQTAAYLDVVGGFLDRALGRP